MNGVISEDAADLARQLYAMDALSFFVNKRALVTGASGFIGGYICDVLCWMNDNVDSNMIVYGIDNALSSHHSRLDGLWGRDDFIFSPWDITVEGLSFKLKRGSTTHGVPFDLIFHCASVASPKFYKKFPLETVFVNVKGTRIVLDSLLPDARMIHFSTSEIYGDATVIPTPENYNGNVSIFGDRAVYDESKRLSEVVCLAYHKHEGADVRIVRPFNIYGPGQRLDDGRVIPSLMNAALYGEPFPLFGDGTATRSYCYISDALAQIFSVAIFGKAGEVYNVGNDAEEISTFKLIDAMRQIADITVDNMTEHYDFHSPSRRRPDISKVLKIAPKPFYSLRSGLERTLRSYKEAD